MLLLSNSIRSLNLEHNLYSLPGHVAITEVCNQLKYVQVVSSYPMDIIELEEYEVVDRHVGAMSRLLDLYAASDKSMEFINKVVFADTVLNCYLLLSLYDEMKHLDHIDFTLHPYQVNVNNGILGFAGCYISGFPSNLIEILVSCSIKEFDCSKATFCSVITDLRLALNLLKASICSFPHRVLNWMGTI
ncbi:hypothetical protein GEMRC1_005946 [Eukaryota sp. GEM-RC1]